jgi:chemotaxis protein histidine kinase CheA
MQSEQSTIEAILDEVRGEFIEITGERLTTVDDIISALIAAPEENQHQLLDLQRHIHSIKGQGTTFDFPTVSDVAHRLEDYIETSAKLDKNSLLGMQVFVDVIRRIIESRNNPTPNEVSRIISELPVTASSAPETTQTPIDEVRILLVMPKGAQRKIIGKELAACGFHIVNSDTPVDALRIAIAQAPNIVIASRVMEEMSGIEFAQVMNVIEATRKCRVVIATSSDITDKDAKTIPEGTAFIHKGGYFIQELTDQLDNWGYFG